MSLLSAQASCKAVNDSGNMKTKAVSRSARAGLQVKVFDSRRKQRWVDPLLTPPRSPTIPEPIIDDLLELWTGAGLDEMADDHDISIHSALNELGFTDECGLLTSYSIPFTPGDSITDDDDDILDRLFQFVNDDSPPPTNPPSPPGELDLELESASSSCSNTTERFYDEGFIGEDLINEQPHIFESTIRIAGPRSSIFNDHETEDMKIKHDCMWAGFPLIDNRLEDFIDDYPLDIKIEKQHFEEVEEEEMTWEESYSWSEESSPSTTTTEEVPTSSSQSSDDKLDWRERNENEKLEYIRSIISTDHAYACPPGSENKMILKEENDDTYNSRNTIQGIVIKEEDDWEPSHGPRKTKILVPLKELMETLHQKRFLVAPLGPGKKVIRLTGSETVKGMLGVHARNQLSFSTASLAKHCVPQHLTANRRKQKSKVKDPMSPSSSLCEASTSRPKKTKSHNNMERMRRIDLRNSFDSLKKLVPPLSKSSKCSKVEILRRAEEYIKALKSLEKRLLREEASVRSRNDALKLKLLHVQCA